MSKEEGEETTAPTSLQRDNNEIISLQRDSPEFVSLEEDTLSAGGGGGVGQERKEGRLEKENFRLKEQVSCATCQFHAFFLVEYISLYVNQTLQHRILNKLC